ERPEARSPLAHAPGSPENPPPAAPRVDAEGVPLPPGVLRRIGSSRMRHGDGPIEFAPDGKSLVSVGVDTIRIWDTSTGRLLRLLTGTPRYASVHYSPDGRELRFVIAAATAVELRSVDLNTGQRDLRRIVPVGDESVGLTVSRS